MLGPSMRRSSVGVRQTAGVHLDIPNAANAPRRSRRGKIRPVQHPPALALSTVCLKERVRELIRGRVDQAGENLDAAPSQPQVREDLRLATQTTVSSSFVTIWLAAEELPQRRRR